MAWWTVSTGSSPTGFVRDLRALLSRPRPPLPVDFLACNASLFYLRLTKTTAHGQANLTSTVTCCVGRRLECGVRTDGHQRAAKLGRGCARRIPGRAMAGPLRASPKQRVALVDLFIGRNLPATPLTASVSLQLVADGLGDSQDGILLSRAT